MNIRHFQLYRLVCELGSVSQAAARKGMSQPALSRIIRDLERGYGLQLFERTGRGLKKTPAGERFDDQVQRLMAEFDELVTVSEELRGEEFGRVNVSIPLRIGKLLLSPLMRRFSAQYPNATVDVYENLNLKTQEKLLKQEADIGVFYTPPLPSALEYEIIGSERLHVIGSPSLITDEPDGIAMRDVAQLPILMQSAPAHYRDFVQNAFEDAGVSFDVAHSLNTLDAQISFAIAGDGVAILPYSTVCEEVENGSLVACPIVAPEIRRNVAMASSSRASTTIVRGTTVLVRNLMEEIRERAKWEPL